LQQLFWSENKQIKPRPLTPSKRIAGFRKHRVWIQSGGQITSARIDIIRAIWFVLNKAAFTKGNIS